jgi:PKD repeat protein
LSGIWVQSNANNTLIGTDGDGVADEAERNVISGNGSNGIRLDPNNTGAVVAGNYIGLNAAGDAALANGSRGILIQGASTNNLIGTDADGTSDDLERNVVSGNTSNGIYIYTVGTEGNVVAGNYIGLNAAGDEAIPNGGRGVELRTCSNNRIGGTHPAERNVISGNGYDGIFMYVDATDNLVQGNYIGTDASGTDAWGNGHWGVNISNGSSGNTVGGTGIGAGNLIAYNGRSGIRISDLCYDNSIRGNAVYSNADLGIDLWPEGVTPNDPGDGDDGANHLQNFPVLTSAESDNSQVFIVFEGTLNSSPNTLFELDFYVSSSCDPSGYGEGEIYLGPDIVTTDGNGDASFETTLPGVIPVGYFATATTTDPDGNTSEFSECRIVTEMCSPARWPDFSWDPVTPLIDQVTTFTGTATGSPPIDFTWDFGDGNIGSGAVVQHSYAAAGDYTVIMTATNCTNTVVVTQSHVVTVLFQCDPVHDADFVWDPLPPTAGQAVTFTGSASGTLPIDYSWDLGDGNTGLGAVVQHTYAAAGDYTVVMTATNCTDSIAIQTHVVTVEEPSCEPVQDAAFSWQPTTPAIGEAVTFTSSATGTTPITFTWDFGDTNTGTGAIISHTYAATGTYVVVMTATNACGQQVVSHTLTVVEVPVCTPVQIVTATADVAACTVDFAAQLYGDTPFTYQWAFGDRVTSTLETPTHVYTASGTYTVTLEVWNCTDQGYAIHSFPVAVDCDVVEYQVFLPLIWK